MYDNMKIPPQVNGVKQAPSEPWKGNSISTSQDFKKIFQEKLSEKNLKISQHAQMRMNMRNISLDSNQIAKLTTAVDKAEQKGIKESLILMDNLAFVVSVKNRTVITAVDGPGVKENVFTNIDGAVVM